MAANIHQRLHAVMQKCDYLQREKKAGMQYKIVSHDAVTAYVRPVLVENGVIYYPVSLTRSQDGNRTEIDLTLRFVNIDEPSDFIDVVGCGYGVDPQDKGPGKAISYAVKYCLLKALGLETGDDPDVDQGEESTHKPGVKVHGAGAVKTAAHEPSSTSATRNEEFFRGRDYGLDPKALGGWSKWETAYRGALAACRNLDEFCKVEEDNRRQNVMFCDKAAAPVVESLRLFTVAQEERLKIGFAA